MTTQKTWSEMTKSDREAFKKTDAYRDPTNPAQVPWGKWSEEAQKEVVWAAHRGKEVQFCHTNGVWMLALPPDWGGSIAYRIRPEPKRETLTIIGFRCGRDCWVFTEARHQKDTHAITFDVIDGQPDCASIKMEEL